MGTCKISEFILHSGSHLFALHLAVYITRYIVSKLCHRNFITLDIKVQNPSELTE